MATYPDLLARYSRGTLRLRRPLRLPEGAEARVTVNAVEPKKRRLPKRRYLYPNRAVPWENLKRLTGIVSLGGDALAESEALYIPDEIYSVAVPRPARSLGGYHRSGPGDRG